MNNRINILDNDLINKIAAGEVIENPSSVLKELIENSIDAKANIIKVKINDGGKTLIVVTDDGFGMSKDDLEICLKSHTTSKLNDNNFDSISTLGFRGEALASIASVSDIIIHSKEKSYKIGYKVLSYGGIKKPIEHSPIKHGTMVQVINLFQYVPARLKFLKTTTSETNSCYKTFKQLAISNPNVSFSLESNNKIVFNYISQGTTNFDKMKNRVSQVLGKEFIDNSIYVDEQNPSVTIKAFLGIPTYTKSNPDNQYIIINGRLIKDKTISSIIKFAYSDVIFNGKHSTYCLFININPQEIDVNVSPNKSEIRFRNTSFIRHLILSTIRKNLNSKEKQKINTTLGKKITSYTSDLLNHPTTNKLNTSFIQPIENKPSSITFNDHRLQNEEQTNKSDTVQEQEISEELISYPLGFAKAQLHKNWVISQVDDGLIVVDQHAAHERIVQERIKEQFLKNSIAQQLLLNPDILQLEPHEMETVLKYKSEIHYLGISFDVFGKDVIVIKGVPNILKHANIKELVIDLINDLINLETPEKFSDKINDIIATMACHNSVRSGKKLSIEEMNALLRQMEQSPNYAQCSHGRPTYINIKIKDLEKLFSRTT